MLRLRRHVLRQMQEISGKDGHRQAAEIAATNANGARRRPRHATSPRSRVETRHIAEFRPEWPFRRSAGAKGDDVAGHGTHQPQFSSGCPRLFHRSDVAEGALASRAPGFRCAAGRLIPAPEFGALRDEGRAIKDHALAHRRVPRSSTKRNVVTLKTAKNYAGALAAGSGRSAARSGRGSRENR